ncbi:hypothetical protein BGX23_002740 [Mortierella sp. AD031]|nr:hypothetical protein BGX23_002740 [Mortierella sp. AD031]
MHLLNTVKVLHENPYTGDRITKASIVQLERSLLRDALKTQQPPHSNTNGDADQDILSTLGLEKGINNEPGTTGDKTSRKSTKIPELVAIKVLSSYTSYEDEFDSSSDENEEDRNDTITTATRPLSVGWTAIGQNDIPQGVKFGLKAKREIAALRAAQGHPNVVPFLGFTGHQLSNPFRRPKTQVDASPQQLDISAAKLGGSLFGSALPLGRSLFQQDLDHPTIATASQPPVTLLSAAPQELFAVVRGGSGFDSDYDSDVSSADENEVDSNSSPVAKAQHFYRIFSRQPRPGGIILPLVHNSLQDLIRIGWTKTRSFMAESCMRQILEGLAWIHDEAGLIHRDISAGNILVAIRPAPGGDERMTLDGMGRGYVQCLISDFGCATFQSTLEAADTEHRSKDGTESSVAEESDQHPYYQADQSYRQGLTFEVGTRAYRAPELLFSSGTYTNTIDIWSAGVLFAELYLGKHLFEAETDIGQICAIVKVLGTPTDDNWPEYKTMPDYGKLNFSAPETNGLSSILLSAAPQTDKESSPGSLDTEEPNVERAEGSASSTQISDTSFRLIERMVIFSGSRRPSARQALSELPPGRTMDHLHKSVLSGEKGQAEGDESSGEGEVTGEDAELLSQCVLDVQQVLDELQQLKERERAEADDGESEQSMFMFGARGGYGGRPDEEVDSEEESDDGGNSVRSDDFSGFDFQAGLAEIEAMRSRSMSEHGCEHREVADGDDGQRESEGGPVRAVKRHRGVSESDSIEDATG